MIDRIRVNTKTLTSGFSFWRRDNRFHDTQTASLPLAILCVLIFTQSAQAIVSSSPSEPIVFPGVPVHGVDLSGLALMGGDVPDSTRLEDIIFYCSGALISDRHILSAAHCYDEDDDGQVDLFVRGFPFAAGFQLADRTEILRIDTDQIHLPAGWPDDAADLALLTLEEPAPVDIPRYALYGNRDEVGQQVVVAGYGRWGHGSVGLPEDGGSLFVNRLRAGLNRYEAIRDDLGSEYLAYDFDSGLEENNALALTGFESDLGFGEDEVMSGPGDSGGPVFIDGVIAGVTDFTSQLPAADIDDELNSSWGEASFDLRVSSFRQFILEATDGMATFLLDDLPGDYSGNGTVEQADLDLVLLNWGADAGAVPERWLSDLPTGAIDQDELDKVLLNWGSSAVAGIAASRGAAVPEPSSALLILIGLLPFCLRQRI